MKKVYIIVLIVTLAVCVGYGQDSSRTIVAKKGDGIINVLRSHGMNVTKYYERFLELNEGNIRKGSELHLGRTYYLPDAPDSFENMGRRILLPNREESALFSKELYGIRKKDNSLENTVYYMFLDKFDESNLEIIKNQSSNNYGIVKNMAKELMSHGAKVYVLESDPKKTSNLGEYVSAINRLYLKNNGAYQRLLTIDFDSESISESDRITITHHDKSEGGKKLASSIGKVFQEQNILKKTSKEYADVFTDKTNVYLANNVLPIMTFIKIIRNDQLAKNPNENKIEYVDFANLITGGIIQDYSSLSFEDKD